MAAVKHDDQFVVDVEMDSATAEARVRFIQPIAALALIGAEVEAVARDASARLHRVAAGLSPGA
jgi:hypothetical protein